MSSKQCNKLVSSLKDNLGWLYSFWKSLYIQTFFSRQTVKSGKRRNLRHLQELKHVNTR